MPTQDLNARLARVKLFLCDVDGVLTDGTVLIGTGGEVKRFHIQDGLGLRFLQGAGIKVGWISRRFSDATQLRARELKVDFLSQEPAAKVPAAKKILAETGLSFEDICYVGDDVVDLGLLKKAGVAVAVANAIAEVKAVAHYVTQNSGGQGAIREVVELILKSQNKWAEVVERHSAES